ncbi:MAG: glycosyltransferase family 2 protein [candidate division Zixibacteria bacterium]|nr:glycosyltransferase family 2 protein [candidate division Zixibacteria bacterium]
MAKVTAVILTKNEEQNLPRCLESVRWVDEVLILDSGSTDRTPEIARKCGAKVHQLPWEGFGKQKQKGVELAAGEWVLSIDADEVVTPELKGEIMSRLAGDNGTAGYFLKRKAYFLDRFVRHGGWYPDWVLRLFKKEKGRFTPAAVHEAVILDGPTARLEADLLHYTDPDFSHYLAKLNRYTDLSAQELFEKGERGSLFRIMANPAAKFFSQYFLKAGFLDGRAGFILAGASAFHVFSKYVKLWELSRKHLTPNPSP